MSIFVYEAFDPKKGKIVKENAYFRDVRELFYFLHRQGLILIRYKTKRFFILANFTKISRPELAEFCRNLAFLLKAGVPFQQALVDIYKTTKNKRLRLAITDIIQRINDGDTFSQALKTHSNIFGPIIQALVSLGEETGRLDRTLEDAASHLLRIHEIIQNTKRALMYPFFVLFSMTGAFLFWIIYVLPKVVSLFKELNVSLPLSTKMLIYLMHFFHSYSYLLLTVVIFLVISFLVFIKIPFLRYYVEKLSFKIPIIKDIIRNSLMAFFFEYLSLLLQSGIDLVRSIDVLYISISSVFLKDVIMRIKKYLLDGFSFSSSIEMVGFFNILEQRMIYVGEESGRLVEQLSYLADYYYKNLENIVESLSKIIEPALIVFAGFFFLLIALALLGPIYDLMSNIGGM